MTRLGKYRVTSIVSINRDSHTVHSSNAPNGLYVVLGTEHNMIVRDLDGNYAPSYELLALKDYVNNVWDAQLYYVLESELSEPPPLARALFRKN